MSTYSAPKWVQNTSSSTAKTTQTRPTRGNFGLVRALTGRLGDDLAHLRSVECAHGRRSHVSQGRDGQVEGRRTLVVRRLQNGHEVVRAQGPVDLLNRDADLGRQLTGDLGSVDRIPVRPDALVRPAAEGLIRSRVSFGFINPAVIVRLYDAA